MRCVFVPVLLVALLWAVRAEASRVVDVRVGAHKGYTRVVLETDEASDYRIKRRTLPSAGGQVTELMVELDATGAFAVGGRRGIVESVRVKGRDGGGSVALIRLNVDSPRVADMTLKAPHRIVIDLRPPAATQQTAAAPPPPKPAPKPAPRTAATPPPKPAPKAAVPPPKPAPKAAAAPPGPQPAPAPAGPGAPDTVAKGVVEGSAPPAGTPLGRKPGAAPSEWAEGEPGAVADADPAPPKPAPLPLRKPAAPPPAAADDGGGFGFLPMALIVAALGAAWLFLRRRTRIEEDAVRDTLPELPPVEPLGETQTLSEADLSAPSTEAETEPAAVAVPAEEDEDLPAMPGQEGPPGVAVPEPSESQQQLGLDETGPVPPPKPEPQVEAADAVFAGVAAGSAAVPEVGGEAERMLREIERRLRHIETRLEEAADARERTDRQLAAHTEELRVQRSAIARAQRVLRNLTRPDDGADPAPPGPDPGG